jgi:uncharacterized protein
MADLHEPREKLSPESLELHRAINSLIEELDAVDWYQQRVDASSDPALKRILGHNRDEEIEHAMMVLEYIRRKNPTFDKVMRTYLFTEGEITEIEEGAKTGGESPSAEPEGGPRQDPPRPPSLGSLRKK